VSPDVLPESIELARWSSQNGLVAEMAVDVGGQLGGGPVSTISLLLQRLQGDGVQVALELTAE
jgi:hypothetical protein